MEERNTGQLGICAIIKDEHLDLEEWLQYNLSIGFTDIYLFEDYRSKSHELITKKYPQVYLDRLDNHPELKDYKSSKNQKSLYEWFLNKIYKEKLLDWCAFIDVDEFIVFDKDYNLHKLLEEFLNYRAVWLSWKNFNADGHIKRPEGGVFNNYQLVCAIPTTDKEGWHGKSIINCNYSKNLPFGDRSPHIPELAVTTIYTLPDIHIYTPIYAKAWINHYFFKSYEDWIYRTLIRGNLHRTLRKFRMFFDYNPAISILKTLEFMGTNTLHLIWLGDKPLNLPYIETYKEYLPEFNIKIWTEKDIDFEINCRYYENMMATKQYAKASDYLRFKILYEYGGLYMDTDMEFLKPIPEKMLQTSFMAAGDTFDRVETGLPMFALSPKEPIFKKIAEEFESLSGEKGVNDSTIACQVLTEELKYPKYPLKKNYELPGLIIYSSDYFCPYNRNTKQLNITENTIANHRYRYSWMKGLTDDDMVGCYYIATGTYKIFFEDFINSLKYFMPKIKKKVILISDGLLKYKHYKKDNITVELHKINDEPWPNITLNKFKYLLLFFDSSCNYHYYFNANTIINKDYNQSLLYDWFNKFKLIANIHPLSKKEGYIQASFLGGNTYLFKKMCKEVDAKILDYVHKGIILKWHDETVYNEWIEENRDLFIFKLLEVMNYYLPISNKDLIIYTKKETYKNYKNKK